MTWPGEQIVIRFWETVAEKGVGGLLRPWQLYRVGRAEAEVAKYRQLLLAQAENDVAGIKNGKKRLTSSGKLISCEVIDQPSEEAMQYHGEESYPALDFLNQSITAAIAEDAYVREINVAKALIHAEETLGNKASPEPSANMDDDWFRRWRENAGAVTSDEMQSLWGRVLAGEFIAPGTYSLRTLEFLRNISKDEARAIEKLAGIVMGSVVPRPAHESQGLEQLYEASDLNLSFFLRLQELGILSGVEAFGGLAYKTKEL